MVTNLFHSPPEVDESILPLPQLHLERRPKRHDNRKYGDDPLASNAEYFENKSNNAHCGRKLELMSVEI